MKLNLIILSCLIGLSYGQVKESCFVNGKCTLSTRVGDEITKNEKDCLQLCKKTSGNTHDD